MLTSNALEHERPLAGLAQFCLTTRPFLGRCVDPIADYPPVQTPATLATCMLLVPHHHLLIISPHFPPTNAPDMQRARTILPFLREQGWEAEVLAVKPEQVAAPQDPWLSEGLPADVPVHRVAALGLGWWRMPGLGTLTFRALGALRRTGDTLVRTGRFDLVYFSTTQFGVHTLGHAGIENLACHLSWTTRIPG